MKFNLLRIVYLLANSFFMILPSQTQHEYYHQLSSFRIDHTFCIKLKNFYFSSHDDRYMEFYSLIYSIKFVHPFYGIVGTYNFAGGRGSIPRFAHLHIKIDMSIKLLS